MNEPTIATLCIVHNDSHVLLGKKKKGLGTGKWNGFGGRQAENETIEETAIRELEEEAGLKARALTKEAILYCSGEEEHDMEVHVFRVNDFTGEPFETDEMAPKWFRHDEIPYHEMWSDTINWLPLFFEGKKVESFAVYKDEDLIDYKIAEVLELK